MSDLSPLAVGRTYFGTSGDDAFDAGDGDDVFVFSGSRDLLSPADQISGGGGYDRIIVQYDGRSTGKFMNYLRGIEEILVLGAQDARYGYSGSTVSVDLFVGARSLRDGETLRVDATTLQAGDKMAIRIERGNLSYRAGAGTDIAQGGDNDDLFVFEGAAFGSRDRVIGGGGTNRLVLKGNHDTGFGKDAISGVQDITLLSRNDTAYDTHVATAATSYRLTFYEAEAYGRPDVLRISGNGLQSDEAMVIDASSITAQQVEIFSGAGNDRLTLGSGDDWVDAGRGDDVVSIEAGGADSVHGGSGNDVVFAGNTLDRLDYIDLGAGEDRLVLAGTYSRLLLDDGSFGLRLSGVDIIELRPSVPTLAAAASGTGSTVYGLTIDARYSAVSEGGLTIDARALRLSDTVTVDARTYSGQLVYLGGGGADDVSGTSGADLFYFGEGAFGAADGVRGAAGNDRLLLQGDYTLTVTDRIADVELIQLLSHRDTLYGGGRSTGYSYTVTLDRNTDYPPETRVISGATLSAGDSMTVNAGGYRGPIDIRGGAGRDMITGGRRDDDLSGGDGDDVISIASGGIDTVQAGAGNDGVYAGAAFNGDRIDGGAGNDQLALQGYYAGTTLSGVTGFETIVLMSAYDTRFANPDFSGTYYDLVASDALVAAGGRIIVTTNTLADNEVARFNASAETDASYIFFGGKGSDGFVGGAQSDGFYFGAGAFGIADSVQGGGGADDQLGLQGNYRVVFSSSNMFGIETLVLLGARYNGLGGGSPEPFSYDITMDNIRSFDPATALTVSANTLGGDETLRFDASRNTRVSYTVYAGDGSDLLKGGDQGDTLFGRGGNDVIFGGAGRDTLNGGDGDDELIGGMGADMLTGGAGSDIFSFTDGAAGSSGVGRDVIVDFDAARDRIAIVRDGTTHRGADVTGFALSEANFESSFIDALYDRLDVGAVVLARPTSGTLAGRTFLVADQNGVAGFQPGEDLIVEFGSHSGELPPGLDWLVP